MQCDVLIRGGEVIDPSQQLRGVRDIMVRNDRIIAVAEVGGEVDAILAEQPGVAKEFKDLFEKF